MKHNMLKNLGPAACAVVLTGWAHLANAAPAGESLPAWSATDVPRPPSLGTIDAKTYAFTSTEQLLAFMAKRGSGWAAAIAPAPSGEMRPLTVSSRGSMQRRLHVFALLPANAASDQADALRKLVEAVRRPVPASSGDAAAVAGGAAQSAPTYATLSAALPRESRQAGYALYWSGQSGLGEERVDVWADRPVDELAAAARSWPSWLYVYALGLDGVPRLVRGGGSVAVLDHAVELPVAAAGGSVW